jgi:hypothetical protein
MARKRAAFKTFCGKLLLLNQADQQGHFLCQPVIRLDLVVNLAHGVENG